MTRPAPVSRARPNRPRPNRPRRGMSMVDVMVSLAITSVLLVASGAAFTASASLVQNNANFFQAEQAVRVSISQMVTEVRRARHVVLNSSTSLDVYRTTANLTTNESYREYAYNAATKQLTLTIYYTNATNSGAYVMAQNVTAAAFGPAVSGANSQGQTQVQRLPLSMTVTVGKNNVTLRGSAATRCDLAS